MANTLDFQHHATNLLAKLKAKKELAEREYKLRISEIDREIEAVSITLRLLREPSTQVPLNASTPTLPPASELMGKTARAALAIIARYNDGIVRITDAKAILVGAGILRPTKNVWGAIYTTLTRSPEFEKVRNEKGTFRLVTNPVQATLSAAS
jgi:hypothetical protein